MWSRRIRRLARWIGALSSLYFLLIVAGMIYALSGNGPVGDVPLFLVANLVCLAGALAAVKRPELGGWIVVAGAALLTVGELVMGFDKGVLPFVVVDVLLGGALIVMSRLAARRAIAPGPG